MYQNGRDVARVGASHPQPARHLFGIPRYLWREAVTNASRAVGRSMVADRASAFAAALRVVWFAGYASEAIQMRDRA
jgi:hypothetical protein